MSMEIKAHTMHMLYNYTFSCEKIVLLDEQIPWMNASICLNFAGTVYSVYQKNDLIKKNKSTPWINKIKSFWIFVALSNASTFLIDLIWSLQRTKSFLNRQFQTADLISLICIFLSILSLFWIKYFVLNTSFISIYSLLLKD